ncbi:MAG: DUF3097 domain-containing protein [Actinomycetes bacterium]
MPDRYGSDVLSSDPHPRRSVPSVDAEFGLVVECASTGWCGAVVGWDKGASGLAVVLEDRHGDRRPFAVLPAAFLLDGIPVTLVRPAGSPLVTRPARTASGSVAAPSQRARVAKGSRIWVEGTQDAELVEKVWGADLRNEAIVVEQLGGIDELVDRLGEFQPDAGHRVGVLVDHLVPGSKETRIAEAVMTGFGGDVLVLGHPYIDVWQAVRPSVIGLREWPVIPKGQPWKEGVCAELGWPAETGRAWRRILGKVTTYTDLETSLIGRVEELIDFVTAP